MSQHTDSRFTATQILLFEQGRKKWRDNREKRSVSFQTVGDRQLVFVQFCACLFMCVCKICCSAAITVTHALNLLCKCY